MGTCGLMVRASVSKRRGHGFEPRPGQHVMFLGKALIPHSDNSATEQPQNANSPRGNRNTAKDTYPCFPIIEMREVKKIIGLGYQRLTTNFSFYPHSFPGRIFVVILPPPIFCQILALDNESFGSN